jgi:hypothetical protein
MKNMWKMALLVLNCSFKVNFGRFLKDLKIAQKVAIFGAILDFLKIAPSAESLPWNNVGSQLYVWRIGLRLYVGK